MRIARLELEVQTHHGSEAIDITERVQEALERSGLREGVAVISALHTTCALAVNEPEEGLLSDILRFFSEIAPSERKYEHNKIDNNAHAHLRSLLLSPSLTSLLGQDMSGGTIKPVKGVKDLHAIEVEIEDLVKTYRRNMEMRLREFFRWAEVPLNPQPFIEIATTNPAFQESAMFDKMMDLMVEEGQNYDLIVFDTAAVANAVRLIGLSKLYGLWLARMIQSRKEAQQTRLQLSVRKEKVMEEIKKDPVIADLVALNDKFTKTRAAITDPELTAFYFVTTPESLPISVVSRFIKMVSAFSIPIGGVFVNMVLDSQEALRDATGYLASRAEEQARYLELIRREMGNYVVGYIRQYPSEIRGLEALNLALQELGRWSPA